MTYNGKKDKILGEQLQHTIGMLAVHPYSVFLSKSTYFYLLFIIFCLKAMKQDKPVIVMNCDDNWAGVL